MEKTDTILYNKSTYSLVDPDSELLIKISSDEIYDKIYLIEDSKKTKNRYLMICEYDVKVILYGAVKDIYYIYVVLQHIYEVNTILELSKLEWDYSRWIFKIENKKKMSAHATLLNYFLNLKDNFNKVLLVEDLERDIKIKDKRGIGGERPRELSSQYGFPLYTPATKKSLGNGERLFESPFPILPINFNRKAILSHSLSDSCFTCNRKEGDKDIFGKDTVFEKGHMTPVSIDGSSTEAKLQCKWCNTFYKDKIIWNTTTKKVEFNCYAILRDTSKINVITSLKSLGFKPSDLE